jgi:alkaline phosphatase D
MAGRKLLMITFFVVTLLFASSCTETKELLFNFDYTHDRIWVGKDFWSIPLEDWKIENGALHCVGNVPQSRVNLLTHLLSAEQGDFKASVKVSLAKAGDKPGSAGLLLGLHNEEDSDVRALCYFGKGASAGISLQGFAFLNEKRVSLPENFDFSDVLITVTGNNNNLSLVVVDKNGISLEELSVSVNGMQGLIAIANNIVLADDEEPGNSHFSFDDLTISGSKVIHQAENSFGPVLWTMQTMSKGTVKMMAMLPPLGTADNQNVNLQINEDGKWKTIATESIEPQSYTAVFKLGNWDDTRDVEYRVEYIETGKDGNEKPEYYSGMIKKDPVDRPMKFGGLTCQFTSGYPYTPLVDNLTALEPDMLFFSGDQIYEPNGGYPIKREPVDVSILSYLGKYYMFGWAFGDLMRNIPTICTPDDHDVFHGNLWGEGGESKPEGAGDSDTHGFIQSAEMVNVVNRTQCGQLPDPYDPTPIKQGMSVWYTDLTYGRVSFAIITDRIFKTGPESVSDWEGRHDHMKEPREDLSFLDKPGVELIGERQTRFLEDWIMDWDGADMKVLLSQTVFANAATHHGSLLNYLYGDLDSGGWPKAGRDKLIRLMRKVAAFHINGDQHLTTMVQYGLDDFRDAGWSFNTPAICNFYMRWFLPDELGIPVVDRPAHGYSNTGNYEDAFGNKNFIYAVGNPGKITVDKESRYFNAQLRASGFGFVTFDQKQRTIDIDSWRFLADVKDPNPIRDQFPGWPLQISQFDNLGMGAENVLPELSLNTPDQLMEIRNDQTNELVQIYRIKGNTVQPKLFESGTFTVVFGEHDTRKTISGLTTRKGENPEQVSVEL